ncbi:MAG: hypothetical protein WCR42_08980 [bacterium]
MLKQNVLIAIIFIFASFGNLFSQVAPDLVIGKFTKCTTYRWEDDEKNPQKKYLSSIAVYNTAGKVVSETQKQANGLNSISTKCKYDENGELIETLYYNPDGQFAFKTNGIKKSEIVPTNIPQEIDKSENNGNKVAISMNSANAGKLENDPRISYKYDDKNRQIEVIYYDKEHNVEFRKTYEYDSFGNKSVEIIYRTDDKPYMITEFIYSK